MTKITVNKSEFLSFLSVFTKGLPDLRIEVSGKDLWTGYSPMHTMPEASLGMAVLSSEMVLAGLKRKLPFHGQQA